jgi:hypothetical protein
MGKQMSRRYSDIRVPHNRWSAGEAVGAGVAGIVGLFVLAVALWVVAAIAVG